jgi:fucose permease
MKESRCMKKVAELPMPREVFVRTQFTWLAYVLLGYYAYLQASVGPLMAFLRTELHLSYTIEGLHFSAFAFGAILVGVSGDYVTRLLGRRAVFWGGGVVMAVGAVALILGHQPAWTLASIVLMGYAGNLLLMTIQAALSDVHSQQRSVALLEANVIASIGAGLAPLSISLLQGAGPGWRSALILMVGIFLLMFLLGRRVSIPAGKSFEPQRGRVAAALPAAFWGYWMVVVLGVAIEWCMIYWGADFLVQEGGLSKASAAGSLTIFFVAAIIGRFVGSRLARLTQASRLVLLSIVVAVVGFLLFWLVPVLPIRLLGLLVVGLGIANLYPLAVSLTLGTVPQHADSASARVALGSGLAAVIVPFVLGAFADRVGLWNAYSIVAVLLLCIIAVIVMANRVNRHISI